MPTIQLLWGLSPYVKLHTFCIPLMSFGSGSELSVFLSLGLGFSLVCSDPNQEGFHLMYSDFTPLPSLMRGREAADDGLQDITDEEGRPSQRMLPPGCWFLETRRMRPMGVWILSTC